MIVIARALTISPIDDEPLTHPIIGWQNIATEVNLSADSAEDDNPVTNLLNPATNLIWRAATASPAGEEHLTIDLSNYLEEVDYIAVARHNFGSGGFTC
jgi:hypothetical protein